MCSTPGRSWRASRAELLLMMYIRVLRRDVDRALLDWLPSVGFSRFRKLKVAFEASFDAAQTEASTQPLLAC